MTLQSIKRIVPKYIRSAQTSALANSATTTPYSLGYDMVYESATSVGDKTPRPVVIVAGWMGAKPKQMKPYLQFYHKHNIDTISFSVGPNHVLFPERAMEQMEAVLNCVHSAHSQVAEDSTVQVAGKKGSFLINKPSAIFFHHFSVGGFLYGQAIMAMEKHAHLSEFRNLIRAQIFDSPPDYQSIPKGISRSMNLGGVVESVVEKVATGYLKVTENTAGVMHRASSAAFHGNSIPAPSLWFYSKSDPVCDWRDVGVVVEKWRNQGIDVDECVWDDTPHIQHGRVDPDKYFGTLEQFLKRNKIIR